MQSDMEKKLSFLSSQPRAVDGQRTAAGVDSLAHDLDAMKYDIGELKDMVNGSKSDTAHVKRIVLACERDMEDFTAAMDAVNVDLDDMQEALKAHDAWMEDVSQSLQEAHERSHQLSGDIADLRDQTQAKLDGKVDIITWNDNN